MSVMTTPKNKKDKDRHKYPVWGFRLPPIYRAQVEKLAERTRRKSTEEVKIALEQYLEKEGLWPPQDGESS